MPRLRGGARFRRTLPPMIAVAVTHGARDELSVARYERRVLARGEAVPGTLREPGTRSWNIGAGHAARAGHQGGAKERADGRGCGSLSSRLL
jgi:hypothetical protein